ncbi:hypothetical protein ABZS61_01370 [Streptomyces sp. NPDC005566]|uniref:hypothetical protein n=1 Tax=Streptomyces sp. NPDC005566 TaxID=3156886 RepID=UPI0033ADEF55
MMNKSWWDHPHWNLMIVVPLLIFLVVEDDRVVRCLAALSLVLAAVRYGRELAERASAEAASP